jgi:aminopeptidase N
MRTRCPILFSLLLFTGLFTSSHAIDAQTSNAPTPGRAFDVLDYDLQLEPDFKARTITGNVMIRLKMIRAADRIELDSDGLTVDGIYEGHVPQSFEQRGRTLAIKFGQRARPGQIREIAIAYHGQPRSGLRFVPDRLEAYTIFSTSQWLVCVDAPDERATLRLRLVLPAALDALATGVRVERRALSPEKHEHVWRQDRPVPAYTFGFAAGAYTSVEQPDQRLRYVGAGFSETELRTIFRDSADMLTFFESRAGVRYPDAAYTQVLVSATGTFGQEMSGLSLMTERYGRDRLGGAGDETLAAHELAHQWWGNLVTCRDWTHFWLNEGVATFMAAAYQEQRFGRDAYLREIDAARTAYEKVRAAGHDRSLVFPDWKQPTADDRTLVYQKGAYVLHRLRETIGEQAFWSGLQKYTRTYAGQSVTTADFQKAMEQASGRDLSGFFAEWIYLTKPEASAIGRVDVAESKPTRSVVINLLPRQTAARIGITTGSSNSSSGPAMSAFRTSVPMPRSPASHRATSSAYAVVG